MESFIRTVERGSFAAAAGRGLWATMVGNPVRFLEKRLGALLLNRTTRQQSITEFGRAYYKRCRAIPVEIEATEMAAEAMQAVPRGLLRVTAPVTVGTTVLPRPLAGDLSRFPEMTVDLVLRDHRLDLRADEVGVAIRAGALPDSSLVARALPPLRPVVCAALAYLAGRSCLDFAHAAEPLLWRFKMRAAMSRSASAETPASTGPALRAAALEGIGIVTQPDIVVADDLAAGRLVRLLPDYAAPMLRLHLLTLPNCRPTPKLRSFTDHAAAEFSRASPASGLCTRKPG